MAEEECRQEPLSSWDIIGWAGLWLLILRVIPQVNINYSGHMQTGCYPLCRQTTEIKGGLKTSCDCNSPTSVDIRTWLLCRFNCFEQLITSKKNNKKGHWTFAVKSKATAAPNKCTYRHRLVGHPYLAYFPNIRCLLDCCKFNNVTRTSRLVSPWRVTTSTLGFLHAVNLNRENSIWWCNT